MLVASNLKRNTPDGRPILKGVDITLKKRELTALIGPSGSGKTTLLRCLSLLDAPDGGDIELDKMLYTFPLPPEYEPGSLPKSWPKPWPKVTAVFQQLFLWPHLTLRENILLPLANAKSPEVEKELAELIRQFDMKGFIDRYPNETSGGQRQRAAIARALMLNPDYLLLDEITSALDIEQTAKVLSLLEGVKARGIGILLITHSLGFARRAANTVLFMDDGGIVEQGGPGIIDRPKSARMKAFLKAAELAA